jgi:hypothetical protein
MMRKSQKQKYWTMTTPLRHPKTYLSKVSGSYRLPHALTIKGE